MVFEFRSHGTIFEKKNVHFTQFIFFLCFIQGYPGKCKYVIYSFHHNSTSWNESRESCLKGGGDLVSIETDKEWRYLTDFIQKLSGENHSEYYIGLIKDERGSWRWLSTNKIVPEPAAHNMSRMCDRILGDDEGRWASGEPSGDGKCAAMYKNYRGKGGFNDLSCTLRDDYRGFICEKTVGKGVGEVISSANRFFIIIFFFSVL